MSNCSPERLLLDWFSQNARVLPWRKRYDPYEVLVSEFMLQQTQVDTVLPYFERWMSRYPDLRSLALAEEAEAEKLWEGLGYYARCRNLLKAARAMVAEGHAEPPSSPETLLKYPGIGPYTAGAVASIAHNIPVPAVDGNVERVVSRLLDIEETAGSGALKKTATETVGGMMPRDRARDFNQALMELGALICLPRNPACRSCPWYECCLARKRGVHLRRPLPKTRPVTEKILAWGVLLDTGKGLLLHRRPDEGLWAGFWEIPWFVRKSGDAALDAERWGAETGIECTVCREVGEISFSFTKNRVTAGLLFCRTGELSGLLREKIRAGEWAVFGSEELDRLALPASGRKFLRLLRDRPSDVPEIPPIT